MIHIGRGHIVLMIGDIQSGKTEVDFVTIINQKEFYDKGEPVYCIYVAVGQKASTVAALADTLEKAGALQYTVIVSANASDPAPMQFYAPLAGAAVGEFFRDTGRPALIVFDDLSKQAVAYREVSLLLRRPPEKAYQGMFLLLKTLSVQQYNDDKIADERSSVIQQVEDGQALLLSNPSRRCFRIHSNKRYIYNDGQIFLESNYFYQA